MSGDRFDALARALAEPMPRSRLLRVLGGAVLAAAVPALSPRGTRVAAAAPTRQQEHVCHARVREEGWFYCTQESQACFPTCCPQGRDCRIGPCGSSGCCEVDCPCSPDHVCGDSCCAPNAPCCGSVCCEPGGTCADPDIELCCASGETVCKGKTTVSCCKPSEFCCDGRCCSKAKHASCCKGKCCAGACCKGKCCKKGQRCKRGTCTPCPRSAPVVCGTLCCKPGSACCGGHCCPAEHACCGETCCDSQNDFVCDPATLTCVQGDVLPPLPPSP